MSNVNPLSIPSPKPSPGGRPKNSDRRSREYLVKREVRALVEAARKRGRYGVRDAALIQLAYSHGLRVSEAVNMKWEQVDLGTCRILVNRLKSSHSGEHPLSRKDIKALMALRREFPDSPHLFVNERGGPLGRGAAHYLVREAGKAAGLPFPVHFYMLRHACGYGLANASIETRRVQAWLGHKSIQHGVRYTSLAGKALQGFEKVFQKEGCKSANRPSLKSRRASFA